MAERHAVLWACPRNVQFKSMSFKKAENRLSRRFPFLNLRGLAEVDHLSVKLSVETPKDDMTRYTFNISFMDCGTKRGSIAFEDSMGQLSCLALYPNLPQNGSLGRTIFALLILKEGSLAGRELRMDYANPYSLNMALKMDGFAPKCLSSWGKGSHEVSLMVPRLTEREASAVEWYCRNILRISSGSKGKLYG